MAYSYTAFKEADQCMRKYYEMRVARSIKYVQSEEAAFGDKVHKALEEYGRCGTELPDYAAPYEQPVATLLRSTPGELMFEYAFNLDADWKPVDMMGARYNPNVVWTGKADVLAVDKGSGVATVVDYKVGNDKYPDTRQLAMMAVYTMLEFKTVNRVDGMLMFLKTGRTVTETFARSAMDKHITWMANMVDKIEDAHESGSWPALRSPLCPWCAVTTCENWREKPRKKV